MCKYCEAASHGGENYIVYVGNMGSHIVKDNENGTMMIRIRFKDPLGYSYPHSFSYSAPIAYCPWCGRKLEVPKPEATITKDVFGLLLKRVEELEERLNNEHDRVTKLCAVSEEFMDRVRPNMAIVNSDKEIFRQSLRYLSNN